MIMLNNIFDFLTKRW